jgi:hypothetical protein
MTDDLTPTRVPYKVWRNPTATDESPVYMGEFYPPQDQGTFTFVDFEELGFPQGCYSVHIPACVRDRYVLPEWQTVYVGPHE